MASRLPPRGSAPVSKRNTTSSAIDSPVPGTETPASSVTVYRVAGARPFGTKTAVRLCASHRPSTAGVIRNRSCTPVTPSWLKVSSMPASRGTDVDRSAGSVATTRRAPWDWKDHSSTTCPPGSSSREKR
jgi:hypothetical protein